MALKPTVKEDGVTKREKYLARLAERTFFGLWSFPNVYTDEGVTKNGIGKELCDLLLVFDNEVVIFSDKDIKFSTNVETRVAWDRWYKKAVVKSARQLYGAESWIRKFPERIFLDKKCEHKFPIDIPVNTYNIHLVAVTCNSNNAARNFFGGSSSSSLVQVYGDYRELQVVNPFYIGDIAPEKTFVHILDEYTLELLVSELDTAPDFIHYLKEKVRAIRYGEVAIVAGEEEFLAHYFRGRGSEDGLLGKMQNPAKDIGYPLSLMEGLWDEYKQGFDYKYLNEIKKDSYLLDHIIDRFSFHILAGTVGRGEELDYQLHEIAVRQLASENRISRILISRAIIEKFEEVPKDRRSSRILFSPTDKEKLYVILFIPRDEGQLYSEYRDERAYYVEAYALVVKYKYQNAKNIVVLAMEPKEADGRSEDICCYEYVEELPQEAKLEAERLIREERILSDIWVNRSVTLRRKDKSRSPYRNMNVNLGRNDRCHCGSGLKYKKCCLNSRD